MMTCDVDKMLRRVGGESGSVRGFYNTWGVAVVIVMEHVFCLHFTYFVFADPLLCIYLLK